MVCLHGFTDTWRTWQLVHPKLEGQHDVLAPTLLGHAGGPPVDGLVSTSSIVEGVERAAPSQRPDDGDLLSPVHAATASAGSFPAVAPPSIGIVTPVIQPAPSPARKRIASTTSSG